MKKMSKVSAVIIACSVLVLISTSFCFAQVTFEKQGEKTPEIIALENYRDSLLENNEPVPDEVSAKIEFKELWNCN